MSDYLSERNRWTKRFSHFIKIMEIRRFKVARTDCLLVFSERKEKPQDTAPDIETSRRLRAPVLAGVLSGEGIGVGPISQGDSTSNYWLPSGDETPSSGDTRGHHRFVQFAFQRGLFAMDLPNTTLSQYEAHTLFRDRSGFMRESELDHYLSFAAHKERFDPVWKAYLYGDECSAVEDTVYLFFGLWRFPVDSVLFVRASSFHGPYKWERGYPVR